MTQGEYVDLLVFALEDMRCGLPVAAVERVVRAAGTTALPGAPAPIVGVIDVAGQVVPVLSLRRRFDLAPREEPSVDDHFVIAHTGRRRVALVVDAPTAVVHGAVNAIVAAEQIAPGLVRLAGVANIEGTLVLIQDLAAWLSTAEDEALDAALAEAGGHGGW